MKNLNEVINTEDEQLTIFSVLFNAYLLKQTS